MSPDDKDRLGDTLHRKEKADEDRFFAERERERLAKQRAAAAPPLVPSCPRCGTALSTTTRVGVSVETCPAGHGMWLDHGEIATIAKREKDSWLSRLLGVE